jgi:poly(3-hydroxybutyrate) depolymerase
MGGKLQGLARRALWALAALASLATLAARAAPVSLPNYGADILQTSVSGLSAGAYMAVQMHVAHSAIMQGAGVFAGGPYHCAEATLFIAQTRCMRPNFVFPAPQPGDIAYFARLTRERAAAGLIDDPANLARQKAWIFVGSLDDVVRPAVADSLAAYYAYFMAPENIVLHHDMATFHNQVVLEGDRRVHPCNYKNNSALRDAYVNDCDYDAAGELLQHIYGALAPRNGGAPAGRLIEFDQREFVANPRSHGLDDSGWAYVPASCEAGARCRVHVAFHGCFQYAGYIADAYMRNSGLNPWADTNRIIVLYPQTVAVAGRNPNGCFDWWGYTSGAYDTRDGIQIAAVRRMIDRVAGAPPAGAERVLVIPSRAADDGYVKALAGGAGAQAGRYTSLAVGRASDDYFARALLSFDTSAIPAAATVTRAFVRVTHHSTHGRPWDAPGAGALAIDIRNGAFGSGPATGADDWAAEPTAAGVAVIPRFDGASQRSGDFSAQGLAAIGRGGGALTQLRLQFGDAQQAPGYLRLQDGDGATLIVAYR